MRKETRKNLFLTRHIQGKRDKGKKHITHMMNLSECVVEQGLEEIKFRHMLLTARKDRIFWRAIIPEGTRHFTRQILITCISFNIANMFILSLFG